MKYLIDKDKFLEEIDEKGPWRIINNGGKVWVSVHRVEAILSKHTKDLPKKKDFNTLDSTEMIRSGRDGAIKGYNLCLEDCDKV